MTESTNTSSILFDSASEQRVELLIQYRGAERTVAHWFAPMTDEQFFQYEERKQVRALVSGQDLLVVRNEDQELAAAEWLWNELALGREGYVERDDWRHRTNLWDKAQAVREGLLAVYVAREGQDAGQDAEEIAPELVDDDLGTEIALECFFNGELLITRHGFRAPAAAEVKEYDRLMRVADNLIARNRRTESAQILIPSKARELAVLYDRLIVQAEGYAGRVPAHHKREAVLELFSREARVTEKVALLAPLVAARAAAEFAGEASHANLCPGEAACERFQTAAGADPAAKAANACTGCTLLPTKIGAGAGELEAELATIERVRRERDSGGGLELTAISGATWELVQWWDQLAARLDRRQRYETRELLTALLSTGARN